jgi:adenylate cyclase
VVGIVAPEDHYLGRLRDIRQGLLRTSVAVMAISLLLGALVVQGVRRGLGQIVEATARLRNFDFAATPARSPFHDVQEVMGGVELAKTAMRAMGKYVPVDLVRHLYQTRREPVLGGELIEVSLMFSDIKDFTGLAETLSPDELARTLGRYLEVMTAAIQAQQGIIDKYIGDAIMAVWNAPRPCRDHAGQACRAALACVEASRSLYASAAWGRPPLTTRFGLHRGEAMVGHFGAPDRMSYTALGDAVNLASRLEGLNKEYGTTIIVSEAVRAAAGNGFEFRLLDRVAVKGKARGVRVYELRGEAGSPDPGLDAARAYERAFEAFSRREFASALGILEALAQDPPSVTLAARCRTFIEDPPPPGWDGTYVASAK